MDPLRELIDLKVSRVISLLLKNKDEFFHLQKLSQLAKVPIATTSRIVDKLVKLGIAERTVVGSFKIYRIAGKWKDESFTGAVLANRALIDKKYLKVLTVLAKGRKEFFHLQKISKETGVPISTISRIIDRLVKIGLVEKTTVGAFKIYRITQDSKNSGLRKTLSI